MRIEARGTDIVLVDALRNPEDDNGHDGAEYDLWLASDPDYWPLKGDEMLDARLTWQPAQSRLGILGLRRRRKV